MLQENPQDRAYQVDADSRNGDCQQVVCSLRCVGVAARSTSRTSRPEEPSTSSSIGQSWRAGRTPEVSAVEADLDQPVNAGRLCGRAGRACECLAARIAWRWRFFAAAFFARFLAVVFDATGFSAIGARRSGRWSAPYRERAVWRTIGSPLPARRVHTLVHTPACLHRPPPARATKNPAIAGFFGG